MRSAATPSNTDIDRWRADTPGVANRIHLNNAGAGLMTRGTVDAITGHIQLEAAIGGYEAEAAVAGRAADAYAGLARILGATPANIALVENATVAVSQALSSIDFAPGDVIVTTHNDYTSNQLMYLALQRRHGIEVRRADDLGTGGVDPAAVRRLLRDPRVRLVALTWVPTNSGLVQPAEQVGQVCAEAGIPYLVDACQVVGQLPVDVGRLHCDFLAGTARKFLRGPRGIGFLYVGDRPLGAGAYPFGLDMRGAELVDDREFELAPDARRFENWEYAYALILGLGEAVRYLEAVGIDVASARIQALAAHVRTRLAETPGVQLADRGERLCGLVTAAIEGWSAADLVLRLRERNINTTASIGGPGPRTAARANGASLLRLSPHYFNTTEEIDAAVAALREILERG